MNRNNINDMQFLSHFYYCHKGGIKIINSYGESFGILKNTLPLPFALDHINCYLLKGKKGCHILDTGLNMPFSHSGWEDFLQNNGVGWNDIKGIYVTHYHPDHYGSCGWLQQKTGAPVYMSEREYKNVQYVWLSGFDFMDKFNGHCIKNGVPEELLEKINGIMIKSARSVYPDPPDIDIVSEGDEVMLGDYSYRAICTPGHSDGHLCFFNEAHGLLLSGDHLLPKITSNVGLWPGSEPNPLKLFFHSLRKVEKLKPSFVAPAHGWYFDNVSFRVNELLVHHEERLQFMADKARGGKTAYDISKEVFGTNLTLHEVRFAIAETIAHLVYLESEERIKSCIDKGVTIYYPENG